MLVVQWICVVLTIMVSFSQGEYCNSSCTTDEDCTNNTLCTTCFNFSCCSSCGLPCGGTDNLTNIVCAGACPVCSQNKCVPESHTTITKFSLAVVLSVSVLLGIFICVLSAIIVGCKLSDDYDQDPMLVAGACVAITVICGAVGVGIGFGMFKSPSCCS